MTFSEVLGGITFESKDVQFKNGTYTENGEIKFTDDIENAEIEFTLIFTAPKFIELRGQFSMSFNIDELEQFALNIYLPTLGYHQGYDDTPIQYPMVQVDGFHRLVHTIDEWLSFCEKFEKLDFLNTFLSFHKKNVVKDCKNDFSDMVNKKFVTLYNIAA